VNYLCCANCQVLGLCAGMDSLDPCIFILVAQSHLNDRLQRSILNSFNQRISIKYHLFPLGLEECKEFILHAFKANGVSCEIFTEPAFKAVYSRWPKSLV
jgi:type II secretory pathway predicted ATPase ExeA